MKKRILTLAVLASMSSMAAVAAEEKAEIDMSDPTDVYTTLGLGYGNKGLDFSSMLLLSSTETQKSGIIFDAKDVLNENGEYSSDAHRTPNSTTYRLRWGTINTTNGLGLTLDAVNLDHTFFGRMTVAQFGTLATIPIGDDFIMFPIAFVGGALIEDNTLDMIDQMVAKATPAVSKALAEAQAEAEAEFTKRGQDIAAMPTTTQAEIDAKMAAAAQLQADIDTAQAESAKMMADAQLAYKSLNATSEGMSMPSVIATGMVYARYAITDKLWALGSYSYTRSIQGKSWEDGILEGGLQMPNQMYDITIGYQLTDRQNITAYYGSDDSSDTDDKWKISYNYAF